MSVTVAIAACAMLVSGVIVIATTTLQVEYEVTAGILSAAAGAVAFAAAWVVGVMVSSTYIRAILNILGLLDKI